ncbi:MAG: P1 family peptidase [Thermomicrobiales bacterium]
MSYSRERPRLRDLGITVGAGDPGPLNAITDVDGVRVGHVTLIKTDGSFDLGRGPVRTGVTAIHPHEGSVFRALVPAAIEILNGAGEITGRSQIDEYGTLETPILITNTFSVGAVHQGCVEWLTAREPDLGTSEFVVPVVAETYDGFLNDIAGQHVTPQHAKEALDSASAAPVAEGNVGGGTGMILFGFKGGVGTASRRVAISGSDYTVGVLIQGNFGSRTDLLIDGVPVGREIIDFQLEGSKQRKAKEGSVIVVIATDAPLSDRQLSRLCRRGVLGLGRVGAIAGNSSGDLLIAFSNARECRAPRRNQGPFVAQTHLRDDVIDALFRSTIEATSEAVLNALIAAETMTGRDGNRAHALPHVQLLEIMRRYGRLRS